MCIVSIVANNSGSVVVSFNRDEDRNRPFREPSFIEDAADVFCPLDLLAGGTWIGKNKSHIMFLQNGGTKPHKRQPPYGQSRGILLMELLKGISSNHIFNCLNAIKTEPFTLCMLDINTLNLEKYVYENEELTRQFMIDLPQNFFINLSSTLYSNEAKYLISKEFEKINVKDSKAILEFHMQHTIGGPGNPYVKHPVMTSSITQFIIAEGRSSCHFVNLVKNQVFEYQLY